MGDLTFLMNRDRGTNAFYGLAKQYFKAAGADVVEAPPAGQTLEGVLLALAGTKKEQKVVNIVCHAMGFSAMYCPLTAAAQVAKQHVTTADDLRNALAARLRPPPAKSLAPPSPTVINANTRIVIYGCDVGRSTEFVKLLSGLFGGPGELLAPRRMGVFMLAGSKVVYRQAQTWSLLRKASIIPAGKTAPKDGWPKFREAFVTDAATKFSGVLVGSVSLPTDSLARKLTEVASTATEKLGPTFFIEEAIDILPAPGQTAAAAAASVAPQTNGDPVTLSKLQLDQADDTTVVTKATSADTYAVDAAKKVFVITIWILAKVLDAAVKIEEGDGYRKVSTSPARAPSPGPKPTTGGPTSGGGGGGGAPDEPTAFEDDLRALLDELVADGAPQPDVDAILAAVPQGDATEGIVTEVPDAPPLPDDLANLALPPDEEA